jgi:hypothetical protein
MAVKVAKNKTRDGVAEALRGAYRAMKRMRSGVVATFERR